MTSLNLVHWLDVARWLALYPADIAITRLLRHLGELLQADQTWVFRYNERVNCLIQTHKWVRDDYCRAMEDLQELPAYSLQNLYEMLQHGRAVQFSDTTWFGGSSELTQRMALAGIRSMIAVPIFVGRQFFGILGQNTEQHPHEWNRDACATLETSAEIIGGIFAKEASATTATEPARTPPVPVLYVVNDNGVTTLAVEQILYVSSERNHACLHTIDGQRLDGLRSLSEWENFLPPEKFMRVHRSHVANIDTIDRLDRAGGAWRLWLADGMTSLPVGRPHRVKLQKLLVSRQPSARPQDTGTPPPSGSGGGQPAPKTAPIFLRPMA